MFWVRLKSSAVLVVLALLLLLTGGSLLGAAAATLSIVAYRELMHACKVEKEGKAGLLEYVGYAGIFLYYLTMMLTENFMWGLGCLVLLFLAQMGLYVFRFPRYQAGQVMASCFCALYPAVLFSFIYLTRQLQYGVYLVWMIFISSWICDTCAYLVGMAFGKHKLAPVLSPKKSVEGAVGGVAGSALISALFAWIFLTPMTKTAGTAGAAALIGAVGAVISQIGDLAASAIKRNHDVKDYGKLIPGHGGIMDRFDSVLFTAPVIYYLSVAILQVGH